MVHQVGNSLYTAIMCYVNIESHRLIVGFRYPLGGEGIVPTVVPHVARKKTEIPINSKCRPADRVLLHLFFLAEAAITMI